MSITIPNNINIPKISNAPKIDGKLSDKEWGKAASSGGFVQSSVHWGQKASEDTQVLLQYDEQNLYIGVRCSSGDPSTIRANFANRDQILQDDLVTIYLDSQNTGKSGMFFGVNPRGIQTDGKIDKNNELDYSWDAVFETAAVINEHGWSAEFAIPFSSLRFSNRNRVKDVGILVSRSIPAISEVSTWPALRQNIESSIQQSGRIQGIETSPEHSIDMTPYVAGGYQGEIGPDGKMGHTGLFDIGVDAKYACGSNIVLDVALNPDFSQIEADADVVEINRRYELRLPEKRALFLEGAEKFSTPIEVFYSRRISDPLSAVKLTGKSGPYSYGIISSYDVGVEGEPDAYYNILRFKNDFAPQSHIGFIYTDKEYKGQTSQEYLYNRVFGVDADLHFKEYFNFSIQGLYSWTEAENDSQALSLKDPALFAEIKRNDGKLKLALSYANLRPEFIAAAGYIEKPTTQEIAFKGQYVFLPGDTLRVLSPVTVQEVLLDSNQEIQETRHGMVLSMEFDEQNVLEPYYGFSLEQWRGKTYKKNEFSLFFQNDTTKYFSGRLIFETGNGIYYDQEDPEDLNDKDDSFLGWKYAMILQGTLRPTSAVSLDLSAVWEDFRKSPTGANVYDVWIFQEKVNYQPLPKLFLRAIADQNTIEQSAAFSFLIGYIYHPGTALYLGYNEDISYADGLQSTGRTIFAKASYHWQY
ncbi:MAG: carbohydrate binding family 9 domain-containing protein [Candidatus Margulisbacteria bacterium]|nr:carbohydrate binding family 9 domain-containing protein [Candidatus Margulisiibacteriota bacterium]